MSHCVWSTGVIEQTLSYVQTGSTFVSWFYLYLKIVLNILKFKLCIEKVNYLNLVLIKVEKKVLIFYWERIRRHDNDGSKHQSAEKFNIRVVFDLGQSRVGKSFAEKIWLRRKQNCCKGSDAGQSTDISQRSSLKIRCQTQSRPCTTFQPSWICKSCCSTI